MELHERLGVFYTRLKEAPPCASAEEALTLVSRLIEEVEGEFCPIPREDPPPRAATGRMYAPQADSIRTMAGGTVQAGTLGHMIYCRTDGSIAIKRRLALGFEFEKSGANI